MSFRAGQTGQEDQDARSTRRSPPNYLARKTQWRVFTLVGLLMLVFWMMDEARKPATWRWLWGEKVQDFKPLQPAAAKPPFKYPFGRLEAKDALEKAYQNAQQEAWRTLLIGDKNRQEFEHLEMFCQGVRAARLGRPLPPKDREAWAEAFTEIDQQWNKYIEQAITALTTQESLTAEQRNAWGGVLTRIKGEWEQLLRPAWQTLLEGGKTSLEQQAAAWRLQAVLDRVFLEQVIDNTVFRRREHHAWFRLLEDLQLRTEYNLQQESLGLVNAIQLKNQSESYRGKLITVRGELRRGHLRPSPENIYGVEDYNLLWLKPKGAEEPYSIYSLGTPEGFPDLKALEKQDPLGSLEEEVEITGYYFKRRVFRSGEGVQHAPLLLAKSFRWKPSNRTVIRSEATIDWGLIALCASGCMTFAIVFAIVVHRMHR